MSARPLVISDCDEVLLRMVAHFRDWLGEAHEIDFAFQSDFARALTRREDGEAVDQKDIWRLLNAFFDTEMDRQDPVEGAVEAYGQLAEKADVVILTNLLDHRQQDRADQLARYGIDAKVYTNQGPKGTAIARIIEEYSPSRSLFIDPIQCVCTCAASPASPRILPAGRRLAMRTPGSTGGMTHCRGYWNAWRNLHDDKSPPR